MVALDPQKTPGQAAPAASATGTSGLSCCCIVGWGPGKTTAAGKPLFLKEREVDYDAVGPPDGTETSQMLASRMPKRKRKVLLAAADVYRPAAIKQLEILGKTINVDVFSLGTEADPVDIAVQAVERAKAEGYDTVVVDTAGRQVIDDALMNELKRIKEAGKIIRCWFLLEIVELQ